jgi:transcriptional regulator NrdR family protein
MVCIYCSNQTKVVNTRHQKKRNQAWRRRTCSVCRATFTTLEAACIEQSWMVLQGSGVLSPFLTDKLYLSIYDSLKHRETAIVDARHISDTVIGLLLNKVQDGIIESRMIYDITRISLNRFDRIASTHYQAFH